VGEEKMDSLLASRNPDATISVLAIYGVMSVATRHSLSGDQTQRRQMLNPDGLVDKIL